jgi:hypothetical protein
VLRKQDREVMRSTGSEAMLPSCRNYILPKLFNRSHEFKRGSRFSNLVSPRFNQMRRTSMRALMLSQAKMSSHQIIKKFVLFNSQRGSAGAKETIAHFTDHAARHSLAAVIQLAEEQSELLVRESVK